MHSTIDERYSELTTFIEIKRNELKLKVTVQLSNNTNESSPETSPPSQQSIQQENIHQPEISQSPVGPNSQTEETPASNNTVQNQRLLNNNAVSDSGSYPSVSRLPKLSLPTFSGDPIFGKASGTRLRQPSI